MANDAARDLLRSAIRACQQQWPFTVDALVVLPDHLHAILALPPAMPITPNAGALSKNISPNIGWRRTALNNQYLYQNNTKGGAASGNVDFGSMHYATNATTQNIWITCITIRLNTVW
uniref:hypothetical protein n=1 Tax=Methylomonas koyamae TaxID=702114 RepID=UPI002110DE35